MHHFSLLHNLDQVESIFCCLKICESRTSTFMGPRHKLSLTCVEKGKKLKLMPKRKRKRKREEEKGKEKEEGAGHLFQ